MELPPAAWASGLSVSEVAIAPVSNCRRSSSIPVI
jgi:hypothetical protein